MWQYAEENQIKGFSCQKRKAGQKWLKGFLHRHKNLHPKKSKNISVNHAMCANPATVNNFFDQYKQVLEDNGIESPLNIWNCNDSGVQNISKEQDVIGVLGEKANSQVPTERGETSTILIFANAAGQVLPPLVIHKGHRVNDSWIQGTSPDIMVRASVKGYINKRIFYEYSLKWIQWLCRYKCLYKRHLLLLDVHKTHIYNIRFIRLMVCNNIEVMAIPAHTSHVI